MTFLDASYLLLYPLTSQQKSKKTKWLSGQKKEFLGFLIIIGCDNKSAEITLEDNIFSDLVEHQVKSLRYFKMEDLEFLQDLLILLCPSHFQLVDACCNVSPLFYTEQYFLCILRWRIQASCKQAFRIADSSLELLNWTPLKYSRKGHKTLESLVLADVRTTCSCLQLWIIPLHRTMWSCCHYCCEWQQVGQLEQRCNLSNMSHL